MTPKFCSACATPLNPGAKFCHNCAAPVGPRAPATLSSPAPSVALRWGVPALAIVALLVLVFVQSRSRGTEPAASAPRGMAAARAMDIASMSPDERADRLFNRVMRLSGEGKADSAAFFAPMALGALEALGALAPLNAHRRYDLGVIALVTGDVARASAQGDTILAQRPTHLLGLALAGRAAAARGNAAASREFQRRLLAAEPAERAHALQEYTDHDADLRAALVLARKR